MIQELFHHLPLYFLVSCVLVVGIFSLSVLFIHFSKAETPEWAKASSISEDEALDAIFMHWEVEHLSLFNMLETQTSSSSKPNG